MPVPMIKTSINNKTFGPWIRKGLEKGREEGLRRAVRLQLEKRFGAISPDIDKRLAALSEGQAEQLLLAMVDAQSLDQLFSCQGRQTLGATL